MAHVFDIDVQFHRGEFTRTVRLRSDARVLAIVGESGSGKTSLLHAIAGLLRPTRGRIAVAGRVLHDSAQRIDLAPHCRGIGYVFQDGRLFPHLDVRGNLLYGARFANATAQEHRFGLDEVVELLGISALMSRATHGLSGGEAQRIALARALLSQPCALLLDEPLSMLDPDRRDELIRYLQRVRDETSLPIVYVSHAADEVQQLAEAVHHIEATCDLTSQGEASPTT